MISANAIDTIGSGATASSQSKAKLDEDLNKFLNLLVTQLKNQDPLDPMDATEFTGQLVQFASVEQQIYQNSNLEKLLEAAHVSQVSNLANYLGTRVEAQLDTLNLDASSATISYTLLEDAASNTITISDTSGKVVFTTAGERIADRYEFTWDGLDNNGNQMPDGSYDFTINALNNDGEPIEYNRSVYGRVSAAGAEEGSVSLYLGDVAVSLDDIISVTEAPVP